MKDRVARTQQSWSQGSPKPYILIIVHSLCNQILSLEDYIIIIIRHDIISYLTIHTQLGPPPSPPPPATLPIVL